MGINYNMLRFMANAISIMRTEEPKMLELGNQVIHVRLNPLRNVWAKDVFEQVGFHHYSIDINGIHGAYPIDLSKPIEDKFWHNRFDIVTNFGTSEHVSDQYECWRNIHNFARPGGLIVHIVPQIWNKHSPYSYNSSFFSNLKKHNNYLCISHYIIMGSTVYPPIHKTMTHRVAYVKRKNEFMSDRELFNSWVIRNKEYEQDGNMQLCAYPDRRGDGDGRRESAG